VGGGGWWWCGSRCRWFPPRLSRNAALHMRSEIFVWWRAPPPFSLYSPVSGDGRPRPRHHVYLPCRALSLRAKGVKSSVGRVKVRSVPLSLALFTSTSGGRASQGRQAAGTITCPYWTHCCDKPTLPYPGYPAMSQSPVGNELARTERVCSLSGGWLIELDTLHSTVVRCLRTYLAGRPEWMESARMVRLHRKGGGEEEVITWWRPCS